MITQADVNNAKAARDAARNLLEAYWSGNPDGNYSVLSWLDELARCASQNRYIIVRNADLTATLSSTPPEKGGCTNSNFNNRLKQFNDRVLMYYTTHSDWKSKEAAYQQILKDYDLQSQTQVSQSQVQANQTNTQIALEEEESRQNQMLLYGSLIVIAVLGLLFLAYKLIKKLISS